MTRGLRNNNPLNIRKVPGTRWRGEVLPPKGATGVFRGATKCGSGPTRGATTQSRRRTERGLGIGSSSNSSRWNMASELLSTSSKPTDENTKPYV